MSKYTNNSRVKSIDDEVKAIFEKKGTNSFVEKNYAAKQWVMYFFLPLSTLISVVTAYPALFVWLYGITNHAELSFAVAVAIGIGIEVGKWNYVIPTIDDFSDRVWRLGSHFRRMFFGRLAISVAFMGASIFLSLSGASDVAAAWIDETKPPELLMEADVNAEHDRLIAEQDAYIAAGKKMTWQGAIIKDGRDLIKSSKNMKDTIEANRLVALANLKQDNERITAEHAANRDKLSNKAVGIGGLGELLFLFFSIYLTTYSAGVYRDEINNQLAAEEADASPSHEHMTSAPPSSVRVLESEVPAIAAERRPIGFHPDKKTPPADIVTEPLKDPIIVETASMPAPTAMPVSTAVEPVRPAKTVYFDIAKNKDYAKKCFRRSRAERKERKSAESRKNNLDKFYELVEGLKTVGLQPDYYTDEHGLPDVRFVPITEG